MSTSPSSNEVSLKDFLTTVSTVDLSSLSQDEATCYICQEDFIEAKAHDTIKPGQLQNIRNLQALPFAQLQDIGFDEPVSLPCNHIIGSSCLMRWAEQEGNTCPLCRRQLFVRERALDPIEEAELQLELLASIPFRHLIIAPLSCRDDIVLDKDTLISIYLRLLYMMVVFMLRVRKLDQLPGAIDLYPKIYMDFSRSYCSYIQQKRITNAIYMSKEHQTAMSVLACSEMAEVYAIVCHKLIELRQHQGYRTISTLKLLQELWDATGTVKLSKELERVLMLSLKTCVEYEGRTGRIREEYVRRCIELYGIDPNGH